MNISYHLELPIAFTSNYRHPPWQTVGEIPLLLYVSGSRIIAARDIQLQSNIECDDTRKYISRVKTTADDSCDSAMPMTHREFIEALVRLQHNIIDHLFGDILL